jgi:hypothetical protein
MWSVYFLEFYVNNILCVFADAKPPEQPTTVLISSDNQSNHVKNAKTTVNHTASEQKAPKHIGRITYREEGAYKSDRRTHDQPKPLHM